MLPNINKHIIFQRLIHNERKWKRKRKREKKIENDQRQKSKKIFASARCTWAFKLQPLIVIHKDRTICFPQVCRSWIRMNRTTVITLMPRSEINVKVHVDLPKEETQDELQLQQQQLEQAERQQQQQHMENIFAIS